MSHVMLFFQKILPAHKRWAELAVSSPNKCTLRRLLRPFACGDAPENFQNNLFFQIKKITP